MSLLILSFVAGVLTAAAPCVLPLLPIVIGGGIAATDAPHPSKWRRPLVVTGALAVSVITFTLLLKASTALLGVPQAVWGTISGIIVIALGISFLHPAVWEKVAMPLHLSARSNHLLTISIRRGGTVRDVLVGASLGPVFSSCSPTYALIVAVILPASFAKGLAYLAAYALGLATILLLVTIAGQSAVRRLGWLSNPHGWFRRVIGIAFIAVGVAVLFGLDRDLQALILEQGWYDLIDRFEQRLRR